jgi:CMP/dCMP kinase
MRITIAGDIGSGKTTIARELARHVSVEVCSTGGIQRQLAAARGITTLELNRLAETDASIDDQIDTYLKMLPSGDLVVESRMAWRFVPNSRKIFLYVLKQEAASRILRANRDDERYRLLDDAVFHISERRKSELKRFMQYYDVNIDDLRNYDRVIDTTFAAPQTVVDRILRPDSLQNTPGIWLNPKNLVPTRDIRQRNGRKVLQLADSIAKIGFDESQTIQALYVNHTFFIVDGHGRAGAAIRLGLEYVPLTLTACEDEVYLPGVTARRFVEDAVTESMIGDWENITSFHYPHPIWKLPARSSDRCTAG